LERLEISMVNSSFSPGGSVPDVKLTLRSREDHDTMFSLYEEAFGAEAAEASRRRFSWQYEQNPEFSREGPIIWVARDASGPLGQMATMRVRLLWGGREIQASWGTDFFVTERARGRGLGKLLLDTWSAREELTMALGVTPLSYPVFKKAGFRFVGSVPFFQKILDPAEVARRRLGAVLGSLLSPLLALALRLLFRGEPPLPEGVLVSRIDRFGPDYDGLWERGKQAYAMCVRRDEAYLTWKYGSSPHRRYEIHEARRGGILVGFLVSREEDYKGTRLGWIVDLFSDPEDREAKDALLSAVLASMRKTGVVRVQAFSLNRPLARDLKRHGFFSGRSTARLCVRSEVDPQGAFENLPAWHVTFGDSDLDR
jgi:GNAT superfamily N-acetyltransferase